MSCAHVGNSILKLKSLNYFVTRHDYFVRYCTPFFLPSRLRQNNWRLWRWPRRQSYSVTIRVATRRLRARWLLFHLVMRYDKSFITRPNESDGSVAGNLGKKILENKSLKDHYVSTFFLIIFSKYLFLYSRYRKTWLSGNCV